MLFPLLTLLVTALDSPSTPRTAVFAGPAAETRIVLESRALGSPHDLVSDPRGKRLFVMGGFEDGVHVKQWSFKGKLQNDWKVPEELVPASILYLRQGQPRALMLDRDAGGWVEVAFRDRYRDPVRSEPLAGDPLVFDTALDPDGAARIRRQLVTLGVSTGEAAAGLTRRQRIDRLRVHARELHGDCVEWSSDRGSIAWTNGRSVRIGGARGAAPVRDPLASVRAALGVRPEDEIPIRVRALLLAPATAVLGVRAGKPPASVDQVVWLDVSGAAGAPPRAEPGLLARVIRSYP
jgi:hypothetical protein